VAFIQDAVQPTIGAELTRVVSDDIVGGYNYVGLFHFLQLGSSLLDGPSVYYGFEIIRIFLDFMVPVIGESWWADDEGRKMRVFSLRALMMNTGQYANRLECLAKSHIYVISASDEISLETSYHHIICHVADTCSKMPANLHLHAGTCEVLR